MTTLKQGDLIKNSNGVTRKVMEVCGTILHISFHEDRAKYCYTTDEASLKKDGYTWDTPAWKPKEGEIYWYIFISDGAAVNSCTWTNHNVDHARRDFLGIYQTKELAEAALLEIRRKLGK